MIDKTEEAIEAALLELRRLIAYGKDGPGYAHQSEEMSAVVLNLSKTLLNLSKARRDIWEPPKYGEATAI